jgi:hypothetical protein
MILLMSRLILSGKFVMIIRDMCERVISNILRLKVMREVGC